MWGSDRSEVGRQHWDGGKLTTSTSKATAQMHRKGRILPLSFIFFLMVMNTAEHLFSGGCSQKSLSLHWEHKRRKGCFEEGFFFAQRLCIWSSRTTHKMKMITNHTNVNNAFLLLPENASVFDAFQGHVLGLHSRCCFIFCTLSILISFKKKKIYIFFLTQRGLKPAPQSDS